MVKGISFESLGLDSWLYRGIKNKGYNLPTPIQRKVIPVAISGNDIIAVAKTGSGKTAGFLIPMLCKLQEHSNMVGARGVVVSPTRELAIQTLRFATELGKYSNLKFALLVGGDGLKQEFTKLAENPDIIIATPGRLMHFIVELKYSLAKVEIAVLDEADRLIEMGLMDQVKVILTSMSNPSRQTLCFSATLPDFLTDFAKTGLSQPILVKLDQEYKIPEELQLEFFMVRGEDKDAVTLHLLKQFKPDELIIIFVATRHHVEYLEYLLSVLKVKCIGLFGAMDHEARKKALGMFTGKKRNVLVTTDVTARGIDIPSLDYVVHYDFPPTPKLFIHRSGRAARAGRYGKCYSLVTSSDVPYMIDTFLQIGDRDNKILGSIPEDIIRNEKEEIDIILHNIDLAEYHKKAQIVKNSLKKFNKTRPGASSESVRRAREFTFGVHPSYASQPTLLEDFTQKIKEFRPAYNILEMNAKIQGKDETAEIMKQRRLKLEKPKVVKSNPIENPANIAEIEEIAKNIISKPDTINTKKRGQMENYRSSDFIDYNGQRTFEKGKEFAQLSLEMPVDDELGLRKRDKMIWDKKKKKYIQQQISKPKFEVNQKSQKLYKEWKKETKKRIQKIGETEDPEIVKKIAPKVRDKSFRPSQQENRERIRKMKYQKVLKHKKTRKLVLAKKLSEKVQRRSAPTKSKIITRG